MSASFGRKTTMQEDVALAETIVENLSFFDPNADMTWVAKCSKMTGRIVNDTNASPIG